MRGWTTAFFDHKVVCYRSSKPEQIGSAALSDWLLRVEAVNFTATMDDTTDLSTQRGASLAALDAGEAVEKLLRHLQETGEIAAKRIEKVFIGASAALFRLEGVADARSIVERVRAYLRTRQCHPINKLLYGAEEPPPVAWMTFVVAAVEVGPAGLDEVKARLRRLQLQSPTLAPHPKVDEAKLPLEARRAPAHRRACPIEHRLPADTGHSVRKGMLENAIEVPGATAGDEKKVLVAASVAERRSYGRSARQRFYDHTLKARTGLHFADGLVDLVNDPPDDLPLPLQGKMAVITADGIGFGEMLGNVQKARGDVAGLKRFSAEVERVNREAILGPLIERLVDAHARDGGRWARAVSVPFAKADNPEARREKWSPILRFETLTYAGEDIVWLVPGWLGWEVAGFLLKATGNAAIDGATPRYRVGVAICSCKMPIRKAKGLAHELEYLVTDGVAEKDKRAGCQIELVESIDVSDGYLTEHRALLAGPGDARRFTVAGDDFEAVTRHVLALRHPSGLPSSQVHRLLRLAARRRAFTDAEGRETVEAELERTLQRADYRYGREVGAPPLEAGHLSHAGLGATKDPLFGLLRLAQLWDVVLPFDVPVLAGGGA